MGPRAQPLWSTIILGPGTRPPPCSYHLRTRHQHAPSKVKYISHQYAGSINSWPVSLYYCLVMKKAMKKKGVLKRPSRLDCPQTCVVDPYGDPMVDPGLPDPNKGVNPLGITKNGRHYSLQPLDHKPGKCVWVLDPMTLVKLGGGRFILPLGAHTPLYPNQYPSVPLPLYHRIDRSSFAIP